MTRIVSPERMGLTIPFIAGTRLVRWIKELP